MNTYELMGYGLLYIQNQKHNCSKKYDKYFKEWKKDGMRKDTSIYNKMHIEENEYERYEQKEKEAIEVIKKLFTFNNNND